MRFLKRHLRLLVVLAVVGLILLAALWPSRSIIDVAAVTRGSLQVTVDEDGQTRIRDTFVISAPVGGQLARITLEPGDRVTRNDTVLARITPSAAPLLDPRTRGELTAGAEAAQAAVGQARAERARLVATRDRARSALQRQQALADAGAIAADTLDDVRTTARTADEALRSAEFAVSRAEYELQTARARLQAPGPSGRSIEIRSPIDGVVLKRLRESTAVVPPGEPLLAIGDAGRLEIVADLLSTAAVRVSPGAAVLIEQWGGTEPLRGRVRLVEPSGFTKVSALGVEEQRVNVIVDFDDPATAAARLGDGYRVEVRIVTWHEENVLQLPVGALFRRGEDWAVFVVEDGKVRLQPVRIGQRNEEQAQVLDGIAAGRQVVLHPPDTLADGTRVAIRTP